MTAASLGATVLNYVAAIALTKTGDVITGVVARDEESGAELELSGRVVINATGPFTDAVRKLDEPRTKAIIRPSQGVHIVLERAFLPGDSAIMVPHTDDGRVLFAIPWLERVRCRDHRHPPRYGFLRAVPARRRDRVSAETRRALSDERPETQGHPQHVRGHPAAGRHEP